MANLKDKVQAALSKFVRDPSAGEMLELEDVAPDRVAGTLLSQAFEGKSHLDRQDLIWDELDRVLDSEERARIVIILPNTPEEERLYKDSA